MINANELRIGNWFQQDASNNNAISRFFTVDEIKRYGVRSTYIRQDTNQPHTSLFSLDSIHPIPLTPEILVKLGFEKALDNYGGYLISIGEGEKMRIVDDETIGWHYPLNGYRRPIANYVHQIQNIYFALTCEELTFKP